MKDLFVLDSFYPLADELRTFAKEQKFEDWLGPDGEIYKRVWIGEIPALTQILEELLGPIDMLGQGFRLNFNEELPNAAIHSDLGWGTHALVLYLSAGDSGTAFWKHKETGMGQIEPGDTWLFEQVNQQWNDASKWEQVHFVPMKFNRALIYKSSYFHSRYPFEAFGTDIDSGRLIAVAFFTPRNQS